MSRPRQRVAPREHKAPLTILWIWLGFAVFWGLVTLIDRSFPAPKETAVAAPRFDSYVVDPAHLLPEVDRQRINQRSGAFEQETSNQLVIAIYPESPSASIDDFTIRTAQATGVGARGRDNGAILFVFAKERTARLEVGYGLEGVVPDAIAYRILHEQFRSNGALADDVERAANALMERMGAEFRAGRSAGALRVTLARLRNVGSRIRETVWPFLTATTILQRTVLSFFASLIGIGLASGFANAAKLLFNAGRVAINLVRRGSWKRGTLPIEFGSMLDTVKIIVLLLIPLAGIVVLIAGGGHFGGAGAGVRW
jgi:uncharacterized membrane protein YgcG